MKKPIILASALALVVVLAACGTATAKPSTSEAIPQKSSSMMPKSSSIMPEGSSVPVAAPAQGAG